MVLAATLSLAWAASLGLGPSSVGLPFQERGTSYMLRADTGDLRQVRALGRDWVLFDLVVDVPVGETTDRFEGRKVYVVGGERVATAFEVRIEGRVDRTVRVGRRAEAVAAMRRIDAHGLVLAESASPGERIHHRIAIPIDEVGVFQTFDLAYRVVPLFRDDPSPTSKELTWSPSSTFSVRPLSRREPGALRRTPRR